MNKTEESDKRWEGGGKICLKAYQKSGVTVILFTVRGCSKLKRPIESSTVGAGVCLPEPTVTTLGVICKANCFRTSEPRLYRQNNSIINALPPEKLQIVADKYKN